MSFVPDDFRHGDVAVVHEKWLEVLLKEGRVPEDGFMPRMEGNVSSVREMLRKWDRPPEKWIRLEMENIERRKGKRAMVRRMEHHRTKWEQEELTMEEGETKGKDKH